MNYTNEAIAAAARIEAAVKELVHAVADARPLAVAELPKDARPAFRKLDRAAAAAHKAALDLHRGHLTGDITVQSGAT